jgi:hypothetical protein
MACESNGPARKAAPASQASVYSGIWKPLTLAIIAWAKHLSTFVLLPFARLCYKT